MSLNPGVTQPPDEVTALETDDYAHATEPCDLVMKGGVTSGIVYPTAMCRLARTFRFRSIGGTSAGALAAALAAAAEHERGGSLGRGQPTVGFARLAGGAELSGHRNELARPVPAVREGRPALPARDRVAAQARSARAGRRGAEELSGGYRLRRRRRARHPGAAARRARVRRLGVQRSRCRPAHGADRHRHRRRADRRGTRVPRDRGDRARAAARRRGHGGRAEQRLRVVHRFGDAHAEQQDTAHAVARRPDRLHRGPHRNEHAAGERAARTADLRRPLRHRRSEDVRISFRLAAARRAQRARRTGGEPGDGDDRRHGGAAVPASVRSDRRHAVFLRSRGARALLSRARAGPDGTRRDAVTVDARAPSRRGRSCCRFPTRRICP